MYEETEEKLTQKEEVKEMNKLTRNERATKYLSSGSVNFIETKAMKELDLILEAQNKAVNNFALALKGNNDKETLKKFYNYAKDIVNKEFNAMELVESVLINSWNCTISEVMNVDKLQDVIDIITSTHNTETLSNIATLDSYNKRGYTY